jgi:hypothetical protein
VVLVALVLVETVGSLVEDSAHLLVGKLVGLVLGGGLGRQSVLVEVRVTANILFLHFANLPGAPSAQQLGHG